MGFLLGAFGKLAAGSRYRSIQARMMRVQSKLRRVTRQVSNMEKYIQQQETLGKNYITSYSNMMKAQLQYGMYNSLSQNTTYTTAMQNLNSATESTSRDDISKWSALVTQAQSSAQQQQAMQTSMIDQMVASYQQQLTNQIEQMRDAQLEPLKDEEDNLQTEKDTLESELEIAKNDYQACQKMEQNDAKMLAPNYTGSQG